jgi:hypothetical protein
LTLRRTEAQCFLENYIKESNPWDKRGWHE